MSQKDQKPCSAPEARQFDFWLGEWDLSWAENGQGTNLIESIFGGCVIQEMFDGRPSIELQGMSVSAYNQNSGKWQQTWVDNNGTYLDFIGEFKDGAMILRREAVVDDQPVHQRMVWYNISENELDWNWDRSNDGGQSWQTVWHIHYVRKS